MDIGVLREKLGVDPRSLTDGDLEIRSPIDGSVIASVKSSDTSETEAVAGRAQEAFAAWRSVPARGAPGRTGRPGAGPPRPYTRENGR